MVSFEIRNKEAFDDFLKNARDLKEFPRAASHALNRTADGVRTAAVKAVAEDIGAKQKAIRVAFGIKRATQSNLEAAVWATSSRIPIYDLSARQTRPGVTWAFRGARRLIPSSFIATMKSGHAGVFKRSGKSRLPIKELFGPSIPLVFVRAYIQKALKEIVEERLPRELQSAISFLTGKAA